MPYYNMLPLGDWEMLQESLLEAFYKTLDFAKARTEVYYNFTGVNWMEYTSPIGSTHPQSYGCGRAGGAGKS